MVSFLELWLVCISMRSFIMQLYKAWHGLRRKRNSVIADGFDEFVVRGEYHGILLLYVLLLLVRWMFFMNS